MPSRARHPTRSTASPRSALGSALPDRRVRAFIGLGANLGDAEATLVAAVEALGALPDTTVTAVSRLYSTKPVGVLDQPDFLNAVVAVDVPAGSDAATRALALLGSLKALEGSFGRPETGRRWGARELDLDILVLGDAHLSIDRPSGGPPAEAGSAARLLEVPHPAAADRLFVLAPLAELAPELIPPGWAETVRQARDRRLGVEGRRAVRPLAGWSASAGRWVRATRGDDRSRGGSLLVSARVSTGREPLAGDAVAPDGSPLAVYLDLPGDDEATLIHGALVTANLAADCRILELGSGAGRVTAALAALGHPVIAVDQSEDMLAEVRRRVPGAVTVLGDIETLALGRRVPAVVLGSHLVNVEEGMRQAFLDTCRRHLAAQGCLLVQAYDPDMDWAAAVGRPSRSGSVTITVQRADRDGDRLSASVIYETRGRRIVQDFTAETLDDEAIRASLARSHLRFDGWVDRHQGWCVARPD